MERIAMIPAAGRGTRMLSLTDNNPKAMLPMNNKPIIGHQIDWLISNSFEEVIIIVGYKSEKIIKYVSEMYADKIDVRFAFQKRLNGLSEAIKIGINQLTQEEKTSKSLFIMLGDLIPHKHTRVGFYLDFNFIAYDVVQDWQRWCMIETDDDNYIKNFYDKPSKQPPTKKNIIGIYNFCNIPLLETCINSAIEKRVKINGEFQISQALKTFVNFEKITSIYFPGFHDLGEVDALNKTRENNARHFNKLELRENNQIRKTSEQKEKIKQEVEWYSKVPVFLNDYVPSVTNFEEQKESSFYDMEFINSTPLQELFLYNLPEEKEWTKIFEEITKLISKSFINNNKEKIKQKLINANREILIDKTRERVSKYKDKFPYKTYAVNGKLYKNPLYYMFDILNKAEEMFCSNNANYYFGYLHGDLFFGNMLYDIKDAKLKIIDPRGKYGDFVNKGDIRYDIAKLNHSVYGYYDFIVNGLYTLDCKSSIMNYTLYESHQEDAQSKFDEMLESTGIIKNEIDFMTGLLFLSMIPLHSDNERNQTMQFIKAMEFLDGYY